MMYGYGWSWGWMLAMGVVMLLVIAGIVVAVMFATRGSGRRSAAGGDPPAPQSRAQAILEERFARGEIDEDEFRRRLEALRS
jgi:putative membrane protein